VLESDEKRMNCPEILVVDDEPDTRALIRALLESAGYLVSEATNGRDALRSMYSSRPALVILDLTMPDLDGWQTLDRIRDVAELPVLILSAHGGELDRVRGLNDGADDYIAKPFALAELLARLRALLRRSGPPASIAPAETGHPDALGTAPSPALVVDVAARRVLVGTREVALSTKEFDLLAQLDATRGAVVTRERLMDEVWDENWFGSTKTLDVTVARLRQKLEDSGADVRITTLRGVGFRLDEGADA